MVAWMAVKDNAFRLTAGNPTSYNGAGQSIRHFCGTCGTPLHFVNAEMLPGMVDLPTVTLDQPDAHPPQVHIQVADQRAWMDAAAGLPQFERWPG